MTTLDQHFHDFLRERTYVQNVTERTLDWYRTAWKAFLRYRSSESFSATAPLISKRDLQGFVIHLRQRGVKPVCCNCYLRALNSFCQWLQEQRLTTELVRLPLQRLEKRLLRTFDEPALPKTGFHYLRHTMATQYLRAGGDVVRLSMILGHTEVSTTMKYSHWDRSDPVDIFSVGDTMSSTPKRRRRRQFTDDFKAGVVRLVLDEGKTVGAVARDMDLTETAGHASSSQDRILARRGSP